MPLDDLREKIYNPDKDLEGRRHEASPFDPSISLKSEPGDFGKEKSWQAPAKGLSPEQKKIIKIAAYVLGGIILVIGMTVAVIKIRQSAFNENNVSVTIIGPENSSSNQMAEYRLVLKNENRVALKDAQILLNYSDNFKPEASDILKIDNNNNSRIAIGEIAPHSQGEKIIAGKFFAPASAVVYLNAELEFTPSNFNSKFKSGSKLGVNIKTSPLWLEVEAPLDIISGKKIDYVINYKNLSPAKYSNVKINAVYPKEFNFVSADPSPLFGNENWNLGDLDPGIGGKIVVSGNISGARNDSKIISVTINADNDLGNSVAFGSVEKTTKIVASPLFIYQLANDKENLDINAGDNIYYSIFFGNSGEVGLRNSIITMKVNSRVADYASLKAAGGFYDDASKTITWKTSEIPELANLEPGSKKSFRFQIHILNNLPVTKESDKEFTLETVVAIDSPDIPTPIAENKIISSNRLELKVNSPVALDVKGFHQDSVIENFGPIPPTLDQETSYAFHWKAVNVSNELDNVKVTSFLPSGVRWTGKVYPETEQANISYDDRTNQVVWNIGKMKNGTGVINAPREVVFQVSIVPQINQIGNKVALLGASILTGKDLFTNNDVSVEAKERGTDLYEDSTLEYNFAVIK